jgi:5'-deoxynucleotidase YfbR-like HD superfamily hydrolase
MLTSMKVKVLREGGFVQRCHARQMTREYNVAHHSFNLAGLLSIFHPNPSAQLLQAALWHDVPERFTGDIPTPVKIAVPSLKAALDSVEGAIFDRLGVREIMALSAEDKQWLKGCDMVELWLWAREELALGNTSAAELSEVVYTMIMKRIGEGLMPLPLADFVFAENRKPHHFITNDIEVLS